MKTPVLLVTHNNLELTKRCVNSILAQDAQTELFIYDNGSSDGTAEWAEEQGFAGMMHPDNKGVSVAWNEGLGFLFDSGYNCALVLNSDTVIPPWFVRELAASGYLYDKATFVTGTETNKMEDIATISEIQPPQPSPDFSAFLIGKSSWDAIGKFDERFWGWVSDIDYHLRAHRLGIHLWRANVLYYHERSSTIRNAPPKERRHLELQADADRQACFEKWGFEVGSPEHQAAFSPDKFGVDLPLKEKQHA